MYISLQDMTCGHLSISSIFSTKIYISKETQAILFVRFNLDSCEGVRL